MLFGQSKTAQKYFSFLKPELQQPISAANKFCFSDCLTPVLVSVSGKKRLRHSCRFPV